MIAQCLTVFLAIVPLWVSARVATIHQDGKKVGTFDVIDSLSGKIVAQQKPQFLSDSLVFSWPYAEMTADFTRKEVYAVVFPDNSNNSILYQLNEELDTLKTWSSTPFWFFDLQFLPRQQSLYGIKVVSTYGRVFSKFAQDPANADALVATELFTLPYMWYVNASSVDIVKDRYFALVNYFPGHPESTVDQKLLVAQLQPSRNASNQQFAVVDIKTNSAVDVIHFISYSLSVSSLFALSLNQQRQAVVSKVDVDTGVVVSVEWTIDNVSELGPMIADDDNRDVVFFIKSTAAPVFRSGTETVAAAAVCDGWQMVTVSADRAFAPRVAQCYDPAIYHIFSAATKF